MSDKYQPLRDVVATSSLPVGQKTFPRILELLGDLLKERDALRGLLAEAITEIDDWAAYAAPMFREKHDIEGTLVRFRAALADGEVSND